MHSSFLLQRSANSINKFGNLRELEEGMLEQINNLLNCEQTSVQSSDVMEAIKHYIDLHYERDLSLEEVSKKFYIDKFQISRLFKSHYGIKYWNYVTSVRMEKALELLRHFDLKVQQVADLLNYADESHFSNVFKKYHGVRPKEYRSRFIQKSSR